MKLIIISGRSGSGKSSALHLLEDEGYYCIDNLPVALIPDLVAHLQASSFREHNKVALCIDVRNASSDLSTLVDLIKQQPEDVSVDVVFLDADTDKLIERFSETRRRHPLSDRHTALLEAIDTEKLLLEPIAEMASLTINTSNLTLHELRSVIKERLTGHQGSGISILFQSFGFKKGIPVDADIVYDIRVLPNPHWDTALRSLTGRDQAVIDFLEQQPAVKDMFNDISSYLKKWLPLFEQNNRSYITIAIGCTGGQHRSVYMAQQLGDFFSHLYPNVQVRHRELLKQ